jgi:predicted RNA methylase
MQIIFSNKTIPEIPSMFSGNNDIACGSFPLNKGNAAAAMYALYQHGYLETFEHHTALFLNGNYDILGYFRYVGYQPAYGDSLARSIINQSLKSAAAFVIIARNSHSPNARPNINDETFAQRLNGHLQQKGMELLDSIILGTENHCSLYELGYAGLQGAPANGSSPCAAAFVAHIEKELTALVRHDNRSIAKIAAEYGITSGRLVKELTELAIVNTARKLAHQPGIGVYDRYGHIVELYNTQINLTYRDSETYLLQQYSTPAPVAFLMGMYCCIDSLGAAGGKVFEPSAGNGVLTIAADPSNVYVNEISESRYANLLTQGFAAVTKQDAADPATFAPHQKRFAAVLTNPPFDTLERPAKYNGYLIRHLDHLMVLYALETMVDNGRAAFIIGGHHSYDSLGRPSRGKNRILFNYLYRHYHVEDVLQLDGRQLYTRMGTGFNVRVILINGRKKTPSGNAPVQDKERDTVIHSFGQLWERIQPLLPPANSKTDTMGYQDKLEAMRKRALEIKKKFGGKGLEGADWKEIMEEYTPERYMRKAMLGDGRTFIHVIEKKGSNGTRQLILTTKGYGNGDSFPEKQFRGIPCNGRPYTLGSATGPSDIYCIMVLLQDYLRGFGRTLYSVFSAAGNPLGPDRYKRLVMIGTWEGTEVPQTWLEHDYNNLCAALRKAGQTEVCAALQKHFSFGLRGHIRRSDNGGVDWELGAIYNPQSKAKGLDTQVPDSMADETHAVLKRVEGEVGGDMDEFVRHRLNYPTKDALYASLSAEQVDAVALAIYNIEGLGQSLIVGDMTGVGKGRIAAALIRYGVLQKKRPVFLTVQANLFSDIYRDLKAIGSGYLVPFIFNAPDTKSDIKDEDGNVVYSALSKTEQKAIFESGGLPAKYDYAVATYSQFNSPLTRFEKPGFLRSITPGSIMVLDEAHTASGTGNTGQFMQDIIGGAGGVLYLSATYAKEPANMPLYAKKTCMSEALMSKEGIVNAFSKGGVALQEVVASLIVREGQMIRRERTYEGIEVNYTTLTEKAYEHKTVSDNVTSIMRDIINFQEKYVKPVIEDMDTKMAAGGQQAVQRSGTESGGIDNKPYYSKIFQVIHQMLFSIKAADVAEAALRHLREGRKPVIAFSSTMASFVDELIEGSGEHEENGIRIPLDFSYVLRKGLDGVFRYSVVEMEGDTTGGQLTVDDLSVQGRTEYERIMDKIQRYTSGITISPIDILLEAIRKAGYRAVEVTGRSFEVEMSPDRKTGLVKPRKRISTFDAFRLFNDNEVDVLLINQSGSTGASAHAVPTKKVPAGQVKQRVMLILQAELDINQEIQKRGRINRTGQIIKPRYEYITSAIPAEQRLMMMLQEKLKSLDANTSSNQKQSSAMLDVTDFLNKIGDDVVKEYLMDFPDTNKMLNDPLKSERDDMAHFVSGRVAVLPTAMQQEFYEEVAQRYRDTVDYLKQVDEYDLEMETLDLQAQAKHRQILIMGKGGYSAFSSNTFLETVNANVLRKPMSTAEIENFLSQEDSTKALADPAILEATINQQIAKEQLEINTDYDLEVAVLPTKAKLQKLKAKGADEEHARLYYEMLDKINVERNNRLEKISDTYNSRLAYLKDIFGYFYAGRQLFYPLSDGEESGGLTMAIFLGFQMAKNSRKPYAPSSIKLQFALNSTRRLITLPASKAKDVRSIIGANINDSQMAQDEYMEAWEDERKRLNTDRHTRYIVTGNLLQGMGSLPGKLVSYTLKDGGTAKGVLMPEYWIPDETEFFVSVPLHGAMGIIISLVDGKSVETLNGISIIRQGGDFRLIVSANRQKAGNIFTDEELLKLVKGNNFEKVSNRMAAGVEFGNIEKVLQLLQDKFGAILQVRKDEVEAISTANTERLARKPIAPPVPYKPDDDYEYRLRLAKVKAKAIKIKLLLLKAA